MVKVENKKIIDRIKGLIDKHQLTAEDLGFGTAKPTKAGRDNTERAAAKRGRRKPSAGIGVPAYRDPATGKTWTGRGKPPGWIANASDRTPFLIPAPAADAVVSETPARRAPAKPAKVARKSTARKSAARNSKAKAGKPGRKPEAADATDAAKIKAPRKAPGQRPAKAPAKASPSASAAPTVAQSDPT